MLTTRRSRRVLSLPPFALVALGLALVTALGLGLAVPDLLGRWASPDTWHRPPVNGAAVLRASEGAMLAGGSAIDLAHPCSRAGPPVVRRTWTPPPTSVRHLESDLAPLLQAVDDSLHRRPDEHVTLLRHYHRQYAGLELETGERVIYVNAFHPDAMPLGGDSSKWRREPIDMCDGGRAFWGIEYDPVTRRFRSFVFNGIA